ncbi:TolB protein [Candidatus Hakubella thermalkaliphila]|uniref:TolB protein n=1 Tax=Candidatus Hakubella thermalkaliphila TaxID=2754717 RepID=A0A6V8NQN6_9ACTN|nr:DUF5050 domain-containing protein [Candidatus Hakubella thermalkaliphila]GFP21680.1 TolB protein [Candidatus Hakubella thermalkaliphila]
MKNLGVILAVLFLVGLSILFSAAALQLNLLGLGGVADTGEEETTVGEPSPGEGQTPPVITEEPQIRECSEVRIIFAIGQGAGAEIYSMNPDGSDLIRLTYNQVEDIYPVPSPDGTKIAYTSTTPDGLWDIFVMNPDGSEITRLTTHPRQDANVTWSFDGRFIFFQSDREGHWETYRMNSDGQDVQRLTFTAGGDSWHPAAHPFKEEIVFESGPVGGEDLYIMDFAGGNLRRIANDGSRKRLPAISPDGKKIVYVGYVGGGGRQHQEIFIMDYDGSNIVQLTHNPGVMDSHPALSPDGKYIVYAAGVRDSVDIMIMNIDGTDNRQLTFSPQQKVWQWDPAFLCQPQEP